MKDNRLAWLELTWPPSVDAKGPVELVGFIGAAGVTPVVLEAVGAAGRVTHRLGVPLAVASTVSEQARAAVSGLAVAPADRDLGRLDRAVRLQPSNAWRPLAATDVEAAARALLTALATAESSELLVWQLLVAETLAPARVPNQVEASAVQPWWQTLLRAPFSGSRVLDPEARRALYAKRSERSMRVLGRLAVRAAAPARSEHLLRSFVAAVRTTDGPGVTWRVTPENPASVRDLRAPRRSGILNTRELVAVSSWPTGATASLPVRRSAGRLLAPSRLVLGQRRVVGVSTWPGTERPVSLSESDGLRGLHVVGPVGVGKSTLLLNLIAADIVDGRGVVVIDPKGDLIDAVLARIPGTRSGDVIVVDPADNQAPVGLNPLADARRSPDARADLLLGIFRQLFEGWGPRTQDILHACLLTLGHHKGMSLAALPLLLADASFRRRLVGQLDDPLGVGAFWTSFEHWSDGEKASYAAPALTRLRPFLMRPQLRAMLGQAQPRWSLTQVFTERKIVLVDLAKGKLGGEAASLLGSLIVAELWQAALARIAIPAERRHPVFVYADEFQDYLHYGRDVEEALVLARAHGLGLVLAHQHLDQLPPQVRSAVLSNARSRILFQLSAEDAHTFVRHDPLLTAEDLQGLPVYAAYARLVADGAVQPWCSIRTLPQPPAIADPAVLRRRSRERFGVPPAVTEAALRALIVGPSRGGDDLAPRRRRRPGDES